MEQVLAMPEGCDVEVLLPVCNEAGSIETVMREIHGTLAPGVKVGFIVAEDGSRDRTGEILESLRAELPIKLITSRERKGYSRAVWDALSLVEAPYVLCLDADGQCDPKDFWKLWSAREKADIVIGWRVMRADSMLRKSMSRIFYSIYRALYQVKLHDPSCPYVLIPRTLLGQTPATIAMPEGFWWEFVARAHRHGLKLKEVPVDHRRRFSGKTQVYRWTKIASIGITHVYGLFAIWWETRNSSGARGTDANSSAIA